jgi:hypothetical protein
MNLIFMKRGLPPAVIKKEQRRTYLQTLAAGDKGDLSPFVSFVAQSLVNTQKIILEEL